MEESPIKDKYKWMSAKYWKNIFSWKNKKCKNFDTNESNPNCTEMENSFSKTENNKNINEIVFEKNVIQNPNFVIPNSINNSINVTQSEFDNKTGSSFKFTHYANYIGKLLNRKTTNNTQKSMNITMDNSLENKTDDSITLNVTKIWDYSKIFCMFSQVISFFPGFS